MSTICESLEVLVEVNGLVVDRYCFVAIISAKVSLFWIALRKIFRYVNEK